MKNSDTYFISLLCDVLNVSRASFYHYFYYSNNDYFYYKIFIIRRILEIYYDSNRIYGAPRITAVLRKECLSISVKTVSKYMSLLSIQSIVKSNFPKKINSMSISEKSKIINLIKNLDVIRPNQVWTTDITYIKTRDDGFVYLSSIIDLFSRKVIAWNIGHNMKKELVIDTLNNAFKNINFPINVIIHSDKGSQYRSNAFRTLIIKNKCLYSYTSFNHSCDENANQESFHASLKKEWLYNQSFNNINDVTRAVFHYIEDFYNNKRIHSSLGFVSPSAFEFQFLHNIPLLPLSNLLT